MLGKYLEDRRLRRIVCLTHGRNSGARAVALDALLDPCGSQGAKIDRVHSGSTLEAVRDASAVADQRLGLV